MRSRSRLIAVAAMVAMPVAGAAACTDDAPPLDLSARGEAGLAVAKVTSCSACHSTDGSERTGPTWKGLWGSTVELKGGRTATVDAEYVRRAIRDPNAERAADATSTMPTFGEDRITDEQIDDIIALLRDLK